jgi:hypothetical protein
MRDGGERSTLKEQLCLLNSRTTAASPGRGWG